MIGGFRSVLFVKDVERWMSKDSRYAHSTERGYNAKFTPQQGRLLDTRRVFESGRLLDHLL